MWAAGLAARAAVEVAGKESEGFAASWFEATLVRAIQPGDTACEVALTHFLDEAGEQEVEHVLLRRLRPAQPRDEDALPLPLCDAHPVGAAVDVRLNDVWWQGTVVDASRTRGISVAHPARLMRLALTRRAALRLPAFVTAPAIAGDTSRVTQHALVRAGRRWCPVTQTWASRVGGGAAATPARGSAGRGRGGSAAVSPAPRATRARDAPTPPQPSGSESEGVAAAPPSARVTRQRVGTQQGAKADSSSGGDEAAEIEDDDDVAEEEEPRVGTRRTRQAAAAATRKPPPRRRAVADEDAVGSEEAASEDDDGDDEEASPAARRTRGAAAAARKAPSRRGAAGADDSSDASGGSDEEEEDDVSMESQSDSDFERQPRRSGRATSAATVRKKQQQPAGPPPRRSGRVTRCRTVRVGRDDVLRLNRYSLAGGEPSVFDAELGSESDDASEDARRKRRRTAEAARDAARAEAAAERRAARKPVARSAAETKRLDHNAEVLAEAAEAATRRAATLAGHLRLLSPFLPPGVAATLRAKAAAAPKPAAPSPLRSPAAHAKAAAAAAATEVPVPPQITAALRPHQLIGFRWLLSGYESGLNPILGDEMGLGKTLQTICLLAHITLCGGGGGPHLVVCPLSVLSSWMSELQRWCPALRVLRCHSSDTAERDRICRRMMNELSSYDVAVTTYEMVKGDSPFAYAIQHRLVWRCLVLDEGHRAKNEESQVSAALRSVRRRCCVLLTGTLLQNNMHELWALLHLLYPDLFTDSKPFDDAFQLNLTGQVVDAVALARAHAMLRVLCLRREKADVELSLPPKVETRVMCPLSATQTALYRALLLQHQEVIDAVNGTDGDAAAAVVRVGDLRALRAMFMQLRMLCGHPELLMNEEGPEPSLKELLEASGKLKVLDRLLKRLYAGGHRVVIFSQFTSMMNIIGDYLEERGYQYARLDGGVCRARRAVDMMLFNRPGSPLFAFLASTRAGGLGINLQSADTVILFDSDWNPQQDAQAMARVHRIGQTKPVAVFRLVTAGSVEERLVQRAEKKLFLDAVVSRGEGGAAAAAAADDADADADADDGDGSGAKALGALALAEAMRFGADALFASAAGREPSDEELDALCDRSPGGAARRAALAGLREAAAVTHADVAAAPPPLSSFLLEGQDLEPMRRAADAAAAAAAAAPVVEGARARRATTQVVNGYAVKTANLYDMASGEPSVWEREGAEEQRRRDARPPPKRRMQVAGRDYQHSDWCQICWEGGDLFCCDGCPGSYHAECLGESTRAMERAPSWRCPHHRCMECGRAANAAGGLIFRCESCPSAYCEEHLPADVYAHGRVVDQCERFRRLGFVHPAQGIYIHCCEECADYAAGGFGGALDPDGDGGAGSCPAWVQPGDEQLMLPPRPTEPGWSRSVQTSLRDAGLTALKAYLCSIMSGATPMYTAEEGSRVALRNVRVVDGDVAFGALYTAARAALLRGAPPRETTKAPPAQAVEVIELLSSSEEPEGEDGSADGAWQAEAEEADEEEEEDAPPGFPPLAAPPPEDEDAAARLASAQAAVAPFSTPPALSGGDLMEADPLDGDIAGLMESPRSGGTDVGPWSE